MVAIFSHLISIRICRIPTELSLLSDLTHLYLHENSLSGKIPSELGLLSKLQVLEIQFNNLEGIIPKALGNLQSLGMEKRDILKS